jgi:hypothetical protein
MIIITAKRKSELARQIAGELNCHYHNGAAWAVRIGEHGFAYFCNIDVRSDREYFYLMFGANLLCYLDIRMSQHEMSDGIPRAGYSNRVRGDDLEGIRDLIDFHKTSIIPAVLAIDNYYSYSMFKRRFFGSDFGLGLRKESYLLAFEGRFDAAIWKLRQNLARTYAIVDTYPHSKRIIGKDEKLLAALLEGPAATADTLRCFEQDEVRALGIEDQWRPRAYPFETR